MIFFFFNDTATTEIYTLSLHDALPIWRTASLPRLSSPRLGTGQLAAASAGRLGRPRMKGHRREGSRSEEHTSELQSRQYLVCRLLLEKKKNNHPTTPLKNFS